MRPRSEDSGRRALVVVVYALLVLGGCYACVGGPFYDVREVRVRAIDARTSQPLAGVVVVAVWTRAKYGLESETEGEVIRVVEGETDRQGVVTFPRTRIPHAPWHWVSKRSPYVAMTKAGWGSPRVWDRRWLTATLLEPVSDPSYAAEVFDSGVDSWCEFTRWYRIDPARMPKFRRELDRWQGILPPAISREVIRNRCGPDSL